MKNKTKQTKKRSLILINRHSCVSSRKSGLKQLFFPTLLKKNGRCFFDCLCLLQPNRAVAQNLGVSATMKVHRSSAQPLPGTWVSSGCGGEHIRQFASVSICSRIAGRWRLTDTSPEWSLRTSARRAKEKVRRVRSVESAKSVSYTHLTLPTNHRV